MRWWLRARLDRSIVLLIVIGSAAVVPWGAQEMPVVRLGLGPAPYVLLFPAIASTGFIGAVRRGDSVAEARSRRWVVGLTRAFIAGGILTICLVWGAFGALGAGADLPQTAIRNLTGYIGLGLIANRMVGGSFAPVSAVVYAVAVSILGSSYAGIWSWPLYETSQLSGFIAAAALFAVGLVVGTSRASLRAQARSELGGGAV